MDFYEWVFVAIFPFDCFGGLRGALSEERKPSNLVAKYDRSVVGWVYTAFHIPTIVSFFTYIVKALRVPRPDRRGVIMKAMKKAPVTIRFKTTLYRLKDWVILPVPEDESVKLPSRGQHSVEGEINGHAFQAVLEPDGRWSHWMRVSGALQKAAGATAGDTVEVELTTNKDWPEPNLPRDFADALKIAPQKVQDKWQDITPMARWEWVRWMNATLSQETRAVRIEKTISKLAGKHRRPCCFNLAACTEPYLAKSGRLMEADTAADSRQ